MKLQRVLYRVLLVALAATVAVPACAALRMTVSVHIKNQPDPGATMPPDSAEQSDLVLADGYISSRTGNATQVFDFAQRRHEVLDESARTVDDYSLFDVVGFRELELRNREGMRKGLARAKLEVEASTRVEDEHELAIGGADPSPVSMHLEGGDEVFMSGDLTLLRRGKEATPVSAAEAARFVQYLRYAFGGHPAVLAALQKEQQIPARLTYVFHPPGGTRTVELKIGALRQDDAPATPALAGYLPKPPGPGAASLDALLDRAWASKATLAATLVRPSAEALAAQLRRQRPLDAYLAISELQLSGLPLPPLPDEQKRVFRADPAIRSLAQAVGARDADGLRRAVGALAMLRLQAQSRRYMLSLFEANDLVLLGDKVKARELYTDVLQANPAVAGAYKDIGDFYFRSFDTPRAWRSWEIARTLAPLFPTVGAITQFERSLATRFPEYF